MTKYENFLEIDIRAGEIVSAEHRPKARPPAYRLTIDFGPEIGTKESSAQATKNYPMPNDLVGKMVLAVVNFPSRQIGEVRSEVLVLGVPDADGECVLVTPDTPVPKGGRLY